MRAEVGKGECGRFALLGLRVVLKRLIKGPVLQERE